MRVSSRDPPAIARPVAASALPIDVEAVRSHFLFPATGRIVTNNAASTQPPRELIALYDELAPVYDNVHRGQSTASQQHDGRVRGAPTTPSRSF